MSVRSELRDSGSREVEGAERMHEPKDGVKSCELLSSGHAKAVACVSSQQLRFPAHNQAS